MRRSVDIIKGVEDGVTMHYVEFDCDSSEVASLPTTGIVDGSSALVTNTADVYFFNEDSSTWVKG